MSLNYFRDACDVSKVDGKNNGNVCDWSGISCKEEGMSC